MYNKEQNFNKITTSNRSGNSTLHFTHLATSIPVAVKLTALEAMWLNHEENIDHPEGSEYPTGVNKAHHSLMMDRIIDSVSERDGIDYADGNYEVSYASNSFPAMESV